MKGHEVALIAFLGTAAAFIVLVPLLRSVGFKSNSLAA